MNLKAMYAQTKLPEGGRLDNNLFLTTRNGTWSYKACLKQQYLHSSPHQNPRKPEDSRQGKVTAFKTDPRLQRRRCCWLIYSLILTTRLDTLQPLYSHGRGGNTGWMLKKWMWHKTILASYDSISFKFFAQLGDSIIYKLLLLSLNASTTNNLVPMDPRRGRLWPWFNYPLGASLLGVDDLRNVISSKGIEEAGLFYPFS
jgi:hypothetical protein